MSVHNGHGRWTRRPADEAELVGSPFIVRVSADSWPNPIGKTFKRYENGEAGKLSIKPGDRELAGNTVRIAQWPWSFRWSVLARETDRNHRIAEREMLRSVTGLRRSSGRRRFDQARSVADVASGWWEQVMIRRRPTDPGNERLRRIEAVTDAALSSLQLDDLLAELLERTRELLSVDTATILLVDETTDELVATAAQGLEEEVRQGIRLPIGSGFAGTVAAEARSIVLDRVDRTTVVNQILIDKHLSSMAGVPMLTPDGVIGVLHVGSLQPRRFGSEDLHLLRLVADRAAMATQARLSQLDRAAALALQRSLLPARPPAVPGFDVAARYIPGAQVGVGGDWYDLFPLPSGHLGVVIGDVAGSGLRAAVVMGRIRSALRAYALETDDPADVLTRLDRKVQLFEPNAMATVAYAVIDPSRTTMTLSLAGHLPPVLIDGAGTAESLAVAADLPLGATPGALRQNHTLPLPSGSMLLLYTDGLIERRDRPLDEGMGLLLEKAIDGSAEQLCSQLARTLLPDAPGDDVAMLALRMTDDDEAKS